MIETRRKGETFADLCDRKRSEKSLEEMGISGFSCRCSLRVLELDTSLIGLLFNLVH